MTGKYKPDLAGVDIYCSCGEILEQQGLHAYLVERVNYNAYITVKPCRRCLKELIKLSNAQARAEEAARCLPSVG